MGCLIRRIMNTLLVVRLDNAQVLSGMADHWNGHRRYEETTPHGLARTSFVPSLLVWHRVGIPATVTSTTKRRGVHATTKAKEPISRPD